MPSDCMHACACKPLDPIIEKVNCEIEKLREEVEKYKEENEKLKKELKSIKTRSKKELKEELLQELAAKVLNK